MRRSQVQGFLKVAVYFFSHTSSLQYETEMQNMQTGLNLASAHLLSN